MPTRARPALLAEALASVAAQTLSSWECLVIDDGPSAETRAVVEACADERFVYMVPARGGSAAAARNAGLERAAAPLVAFLDDDDRWRPDKLAHQVEFLDTHPEVPLCAARMQFFGGSTQVWPTHERLRYLAFDALLDANDVATSTVVARRAALSQAGDFEPERTVCEDYALWLRVARRARLALLPEVLCDYRVHPGSLSASEPRVCLAMAEVYGDLRSEGMLGRRRFLDALRNAYRRHAATARSPGDRLRIAAEYGRRAVAGLLGARG